METSQNFLKEVEAVWGDSRKVARVAFIELFHSDEISLDHDDQVSYALDIGILAEEMKSATPHDFVTTFMDTIMG